MYEAEQSKNEKKLSHIEKELNENRKLLHKILKQTQEVRTE